MVRSSRALNWGLAAMNHAWAKRVPKAMAFLAILAYFLYFARDGVHALFQPDDMMNLAGYWKRGLWPTVADNLRFWSTAYRPMGGLFYLSLYRMFRLNPLPYRIAALTLLFAGVWITYLVAVLLTKSRAAAFVVAIVCCAHATMVDVYFASSSVYDILARLFCMLVLFAYIHIRDRGQVPGIGQASLIVLLFVAALDSKEISVIAASSVVSYEIMFHGWPNRWVWLRQEGFVPALLVVLAAIYTLGKTFGSHPLSADEGYRIVVSGGRYLENNTSYASKLLYGFINSKASLLGADLVLLFLLFHRNPVLRWSSFFALTATLPLSFVPTRGGGSLLIPLFGWALLLAALTSAWDQRGKLSRWASATALTVLCLAFVERTVHSWRDHPSALRREQENTWHAITQLQGLHFQPKPGSKVIIVDDPWEKEWDMIFISGLVWNDPSVEITLSRKLATTPGPDDIAKFDSVLRFLPDGVLRQVR